MQFASTSSIFRSILPRFATNSLVRHHEPDRAALRHRSRPDQAPRPCPQQDGSYKITGTKIFISAGEHDLTENIVHLVLARIEGAPEGTKGISLFVVPKFLPDETASRASATRVSCGSLEDKMGIHGNATCVMNYDGATGWLVGEENKGLRAMFTMMNEARLGVGVQGLAQSEVAYQNAAAYARERIQGRALSGPRKPGQGQGDPIIVHPDVRRTLMSIRAFNEAARALVHLDRAARRHRPSFRRRGSAPEGRRPHGPDDPGDQRRADRQGFDNAVAPSRCSAATAMSPNGAWSSSCAMPASP
jgi:alkylation response protein AidB-like acyl-CoA dehydrogenase